VYPRDFGPTGFASLISRRIGDGSPPGLRLIGFHNENSYRFFPPPSFPLRFFGDCDRHPPDGTSEEEPNIFLFFSPGWGSCDSGDHFHSFVGASHAELIGFVTLLCFSLSFFLKGWDASHPLLSAGLGSVRHVVEDAPWFHRTTPRLSRSSFSGTYASFFQKNLLSMSH